MVNIGGFGFEWGSMTYVMGIVNASPDSFSGDGCLDMSMLLAKGMNLVKSKADILDIGGESTKPDAGPISAEEEINRVVPVIREFRCAFDVPISCDTYKLSVAEEALKNGANIINDVSGLTEGKNLTDLVNSYDAAIVLTSNQRNIATQSRNILDIVMNDFKRQIEIAQSSGIPHDRIILDPGIGFGKTDEENFYLINKLDVIKSLGYPVLLGVSNKSFIGNTLGADVNSRGAGNDACHAVAVSKGVDILRVHDVDTAVKTAIIADALTRGWDDENE